MDYVMEQKNMFFLGGGWETGRWFADDLARKWTEEIGRYVQRWEAAGSLDLVACEWEETMGRKLQRWQKRWSVDRMG